MRKNLPVIVGALFLAFVAFTFARALGLPIWEKVSTGDATDVAVATFFGTIFLRYRG